MAIATRNVLSAGLVAGIVWAALDLVVDGFFLSHVHRAALDALNPSLYSGMQRTSTVIALAMLDMVLSMLMVWLYAAIRPRFGAGPGTAVIAATFTWMVLAALWVSLGTIDLFAWGYLLIVALSEFATMQVVAYVGAMMYRED